MRGLLSALATGAGLVSISLQGTNNDDASACTR